MKVRALFSLGLGCFAMTITNSGALAREPDQNAENRNAVALRCTLRADPPSPPMYVTLNKAAETVQVTMAGQTYLEDAVWDDAAVFWQVKGTDNVVIRTKLSRIDGTIIITNPGMSVHGNCENARRRF